MKLAELLLKRSAQQKRIANLQQRVARSAVSEEGGHAHESAPSLLEQALAANLDMHRTIVAIHKANLAARLADGRCLTEAIAERDRLAAEHSLLKAAIQAATQAPDRYSNRELRYVAQLSIADLESRADEAAESLRRLNVAIQKANWDFEVDL